MLRPDPIVFIVSKILIDNGFKRIFNLRYGIHEWKSKKEPVVR